MNHKISNDIGQEIIEKLDKIILKLNRKKEVKDGNECPTPHIA